MLKPRTFSALAAVAAFCLSTACSALPHTQGEKYYLIVPNTKSPYFVQLNAGLEQAASQLQVHVAMIGPDSYDPKGENSEFNRIAGLKPAGMLVSVADAKLMTPSINAAIAAGIPVITVDSDAEDSKRLFFVGSDNYDAGQLGGRLLADKLGGKGNIAALYTKGQPNLEKRMEGYKSMIDMHAGMKLVDVGDLKGDPDNAFDTAEALLNKDKPKIDGFIVLEAQAGAQVSEVMKRDNLKIVFIAMDALPGILDGVESGRITASVAQKPFTMGYTGLRMLADLYLYKLPSLSADFVHDPKSPIPAFVDTGVSMVDQSNLKVYRDALK